MICAFRRGNLELVAFFHCILPRPGSMDAWSFDLACVQSESPAPHRCVVRYGSSLCHNGQWRDKHTLLVLFHESVNTECHQNNDRHHN